MEFLVTMKTHVPADVSDEEVARTRSREAARSEELGRRDHMLRLWKPEPDPTAPEGELRTLGLFKASDRTELDALLASLPMHVWSSFDVVPLEPHAHDPARGS